MKKHTLFGLSAVLAAMAAAHLAQAADTDLPNNIVSQANLNQFNLDEQLPYADKIAAGMVKVDRLNQIVTLVMLPNKGCPTGALCLQVKVNLPIQSMGQDACGATVVSAAGNVGENAMQIQVTDNTTNHCDTMIELAPTAVRYETQSANLHTYSILAGPAFQHSAQ